MDHGAPENVSSCLVILDVMHVAEDSPTPPVMLEKEIHMTLLESDPVGHHVTLVMASDEDNDDLWFDVLGKAYIRTFPFRQK